MPVVQLAYLKLRIIVDRPRSTGSQQSTAHLIEPQPFFSLVSGEKEENQIQKNKIPCSKENFGS